jgi:3-methyladenine DNA glycosylase AlkD
VDDPGAVTSAQMDRWCRDFDSWAICDTVCFHLFDRTPLAWTKVGKWAKRKPEFEKRAAFALLWGLSGHDRTAPDARFREGLVVIERAASDERNFVKKAVSMALRAVGRRNAALNKAAVAVAERLAASSDATERWVGKDALKDLRKFR